MRIAAPEALDELLTASIGRNQVSSPVRDCRRTGKVQQTAQQTLEFQEPALATADYEHILSVLNDMAIVIERSPSAFEHLDEEACVSYSLYPSMGTMRVRQPARPSTTMVRPTF